MRSVEDISGISVRDEAQAPGDVQQQTWGTGEERRAALTRRAVGAKVAETARLRQDTLKLEYPSLAGEIDRALTDGWSRDDLRRHLADCEGRALMFYGPQEVDAFLGRTDQTKRDLWDAMSAQRDDAYVRIMRDEMSEGKVRSLLHTAKSAGIAPGLLLRNHKDAQIMEAAERLAGKRLGWLGMIRAATGNMLASLERSTSNVWQLEARETERGDADRVIEKVMRGFGRWDREGQERWDRMPEEERQQILRTQRAQMATRQRGLAEDWAMTAQEDQTHYRPPESQIGAFLLSAIESGGFSILSGIRSGAAWAVGGPLAGLAMTAFNTYDESRGEAGEVFVEGLRRGWEPERAYEAAMQTQRENMMLLTATNYAFDVLTFGLGGAGLGLAKLGGRAAKAGSALGRAGHFLEHGMSDWLSRQAGKITGDKLASRLARGFVLRGAPLLAGAIPEGVEEYGQERIKASALGDEQDDAALAEAFKMGMGHAVLHSLIGLGTRRVVGGGVRKVMALTPTGRALAELSRRIGEANEIGTRIARGELAETDIVREDPVVFVPRERLSPAALAELDPSRTVEIEGGGVVDETMDAPEEAVQETEGELAVRKSVWDAWAQEHPEEAEGLSDVLREGTQGVTAAERMAQLLEEARRDAKDPLNADSEAAARARQIVDDLIAELERATSLSQEVRENWARVYGHRLLAASERFGVSVDKIHRVYVKRGEDAMEAAAQDATSSSEIPNSSDPAADVTAAEPLTFKLTGAPVSDAYMAALTDLEAGRPISQEAYDAIPEIQDARSRTATGSTLELSEREGIQQQVYDALMAYGSAVTETVDGREQTSYTGPVRNERRADIIIGLPASGKSSALVDPISSRHGSMLIDSDEAKKLIPEFDDGFGAGYVHEESKLVVGQVIDDTTNQGRNIVLPIVGSDYEKLKKQIDMLRQKGYTVHIHMADIDPNIAAGRNMRRFAETGRFVDLAVTSFKYGNKPREVFEKVKKEGVSDGYSRVDTTIFPGQRVEWTEDLSDDRGDLRAGRGRVHPELGAEREAEGSGAAPFEVEAAAGDRGSAGAVGAGASGGQAAADITSVETTGGSPQEGAAPRPRGAVMARVRTASGTEIDVRYRVVSAGELVASHGENGGVNEAYPKELQPRQRGREASIQQIHQMAASLDPELLGENRLASDGAPIVGPDSVVESGNGRVMAIRRAYRTGKADGYRAWLTQNAERFGIDPADVEAIADPVLIRERTSDVDRVRFVQEANQASVSRMSKTEQALADAQRITPEMLVDLDPDADIASAANRQFVQQFLEKVVGDTEMGALMDARGELSQDGRERIVNALFAYAYGDTEALSRLRETLGDDTKTVTNALLGISPRMADMEGKMRQGGLHAELSLREALIEAANKMAQIKRDGKLTVEAYLAQGMIFSEGNISPEARAILQFFEANKRSTKAIRAGLARYVDLVEAQGSPAQISVFGDGPMSREELVYDAFGHEVGKQYASAEEIAREQGYGKDEGLFQLAVAALGKAKDKVESYAQGMWHGSQYVLEGMKFLLSKIGTGEGTQWEGWGAYLAQLRDVAGEYRTAGQELDPTAEARRADGSVAFFRDPNTGYWRFPGQDALVSLGSDGALGKLARALDAMADGTASGEAAARLWEETVAALEERAQEIRAALEAGPDAVGPLVGIELGRIEDALAGIDGMGPSDIRMIAPDSGPGNLYMVEGPDDDILMAWHDPLDAQPENVKEAIEAARAELDIDRHMYHRVGAAEGSPYTGRDLYHALARRLGGDKEASLWLKDHGVPGHRYLDDWSNEGDPDATYNFVIWDVDLLKVLDVEGPGKAAFDAMRAAESYGQDVLGGAELDRMTAGQIDAVRARYEGTDQWMKAPNGEPTKLSEKQWLQVRTAAFKEWFGDWENDPANASKVVDANGEPLVVWHGSGWDPMTEEEGKAVFKHGAIRNTSEGVGFYFTPSRELAEGWGDAGGYFLDLRDPVDPYASLDLLSEDEYYDIIEDEDLDREDMSIEDALDEARKAKLRGKLREVLDILEGKGYAFNEQIWPDLLDTLSPRTTEGVLDGLLGAEAFIDGDVDKERFVSDLRAAEWEAFGIDGYHSPSYSNGAGAYVAFSPTQIKSATDNRGTFDAGDLDIYHQDAVDSGGGQLSLFDNSGLIDERDALPRTEAADAFDRDDPETWGEGPRKDEALAILEELDALEQSEASGYMDTDLWLDEDRREEAQDIEDQRDEIDAADLSDTDVWADGPRRDEAVALQALLGTGILYNRHMMDELPQWVREDERVRELRGEMEAVYAESLEAEGEELEALDEALGEWRDALDAEIRALLEERFEELVDEEQKYLDDENWRLIDRLKELRGEERAASEARAEELEERFEELADEEEGIGESYGQDGTGRLAPNGEPSDLDAKQHAEVRTDAFKAFFGDWEMAAAAREIQGMEATPVSALPERMAQKDAEAKAGAFGEMKNERYGVTATISKETVGKIFGHKGFNVTRIFDAVPGLFGNSVLVLSETNDGHKTRNNVKAYHHFVNKFEADGKEYYIRFTAYELNEKKPTGKRSIHSTAISEVEVYEANKKTPSLGRSGSIGPGVKGQTSFIDKKIAQILASVNDVSKVVDANGVPEVWYHATGKGEFSVFQSGNSAGLIYFGQTPKDAKRGARSKARVMPVYLNVKDPVNTKETPVPWYEAEDSFKVARWKREGHDGVYVQDEAGVSLAVFSPAQIKSATDNRGTFDAGDPDIYHQDKERPKKRRARKSRRSTSEVKKSGKDSGALRGRVELRREERDPVSGAVTREAQAIVYLMKNADPSTFLHEMWHIALDDLMTFGRMEEANEETRQDWETVKRWLGVEDLDFSLFALSKEERKAWTAEQKARHAADMERWREAQEKFADAGEAYFQTGEAPSEALKGTFERIRAWLLKVYAGVKGDIELSDEVREVFDRMLATQGEMTAALEARTTVGDIALEDRMLRERIRELEGEIWRTEARLAETAAEAFRAGQQQKAEELRARRKRLEAKRAERKKLRNEVKRMARQMEAAAKDERVIYHRQLEIRELLKGYDLTRRTKKTLEKRAAALRAQEMGADVAEFLQAYPGHTAKARRTHPRAFVHAVMSLSRRRYDLRRRIIAAHAIIARPPSPIDEHPPPLEPEPPPFFVAARSTTAVAVAQSASVGLLRSAPLRQQIFHLPSGISSFFPLG